MSTAFDKVLDVGFVQRRISVAHHRAELIEREILDDPDALPPKPLPLRSHALLSEDNRPSRIQLDEQRDQQEDRQENNNQRGCQTDIHAALQHRIENILGLMSQHCGPT